MFGIINRDKIAARSIETILGAYLHLRTPYPSGRFPPDIPAGGAQQATHIFGPLRLLPLRLGMLKKNSVQTMTRGTWVSVTEKIYIVAIPSLQLLEVGVSGDFLYTKSLIHTPPGCAIFSYTQSLRDIEGL